MASGPIATWQIEGEKVEIVTNFLFLSSRITGDGDCSHKIRRQLLLGRKAMTNLDSVLKSRHITLLTKVCIVKAMVFPVVMYGCESWTITKAEHQRNDAFELWCWRRLLKVPWTASIFDRNIGMNTRNIFLRIFQDLFLCHQKAMYFTPAGIRYWSRSSWGESQVHHFPWFEVEQVI